MRNIITTSRGLLRVLAVLLAMTAIASWLARAQLANGVGRVLGDVFDTTIETAILEHWYNVLSGLARWSNANYFFPHENTIGYSEGFFLYGLIYAAPRALGADPYLATFVVHLIVRLAGFLFFLLFARKVLSLPFTYALAGAAIFTLSNNIAIHALHAQLLTVALVPLCGWLLYCSAQALFGNERGRLLLHGTALALIYAAWAMTAFYVLWFFTFFCTCLVLFLAMRYHRLLRTRLAAVERSTVLTLVAVLAILLASLAPFLWVYVPKASETGMHGYAVAQSYLPSPFDILNIGLGNRMYAGLLACLNKAIGFPVEFSEKQMGLTPGVLLVFLLSIGMLWKHMRTPVAGHDFHTKDLVASLAVVTVGTYLLSLAFCDRSAWFLVYHLFPGAKAIRVVSRYYIFLTVPVIGVGMYWLSLWRFRGAFLAGMIVCAFLIAEQLNSVLGTAIDREAAAARIESVQAVPASCRAFFVLDGRPARDGDVVDALYRHNVEAMYLSEYLNLPTINGYSSFNPPDWNFAYPQKADYLDRVRAYQRAHDIGGLCALDLQTMTWSTGPF